MQKQLSILMMILVLLFSCTAIGVAEGLPMNDFSFGPAPKDENYLSATEYKDNSISVNIYSGTVGITPYDYAHVKISHPSQLRTASAGKAYSPTATFHANSEAKGVTIAKVVNAVVAINGDYYTKADRCQMMMRQGEQYRNTADGLFDALVIDKQGNLSALQNFKQKDYLNYYKENKDNMYQVFCFGPLLCKDGSSVIDEKYNNNYVGSSKKTQRSAIAQIGPLEYLLITCEGPQTTHDKGGLTIFEFAALCEELGKKHSETGCSLAFNLDGGNSATLVFKEKDPQYSSLVYTKINSREIGRHISDIIYFATLEP